MPKKITVRCSAPIGLNCKYSVPWADVWLSWTGKPGRKKYRLSPCLCSRGSLETDIELTEECIKNYPDLDYRQALVDLMQAKITIDAGNIYMDDPQRELPNVYTPEESINRAEAERMIKEVMKFHGYDNIICKWKRPKIVIIPI